MSNSKYSILIICEGENTEPSFFDSIRDKVISGEFELNASIRILPEPKAEQNSRENPNEHKAKRIKRNLRKALKEEPVDIKGVPPLKWVKTGIEELKSGTYNEVWAVFDCDNHPKRKEAFELADSEEVNGKKVNIAFTSRSFEYYLLLNFEQIYKRFYFTDCKIDKTPIYCGSRYHGSDCGGKLCINGYARVNCYWDNSKGMKSTFPLIEKRIELGFDNSAWIRYKSDNNENGTPIYDRNPYTNVDILISRLTRIPLRQWINLNAEFDGISISLIEGKTLRIKNTVNRTLLISQNSFFAVDIKNNKRIYFGTRIFLSYNEENDIIIPENLYASDYLGLQYDEKIFLF